MLVTDLDNALFVFTLNCLPTMPHCTTPNRMQKKLLQIKPLVSDNKGDTSVEMDTSKVMRNGVIQCVVCVALDFFSFFSLLFLSQFLGLYLSPQVTFQLSHSFYLSLTLSPSPLSEERDRQSLKKDGERVREEIKTTSIFVCPSLLKPCCVTGCVG